MKSKNKIKILVSGGWGYGNLGDDAILVSTIKILRLVYPQSEIVIMSYNVDETRLFAGISDVKYVPSIHRYLVGNSAIRKYGIIGPNTKVGNSSKVKSLIDKIMRIPVKLAQYSATKKYNAAKRSLRTLPMYSDFENINLYVQAGGGYFNDEWTDKVYSHVLELLIAKEMNIKSLVIGQSIGPLRDSYIRDIAIDGLKAADLISVRDTDSRAELTTAGLKVDLSPDLAISQVDYSFQKRNVISVIIGGYGMTDTNVETLVSTLKNYSQEIDATIHIMVSRLWSTDVRLANRVFASLKNLNANVELIVPNSLDQLQRSLGESKVLISQNLHGLILAWRSGVPCVSLNDGRKFVSFMKQTGQEHRLIPLRLLKNENLKIAIEDAVGNSDGFIDQRREMSEKIKSHFIDKLQSLEVI